MSGSGEQVWMLRVVTRTRAVETIRVRTLRPATGIVRAAHPAGRRCYIAGG